MPASFSAARGSTLAAQAASWAAACCGATPKESRSSASASAAVGSEHMAADRPRRGDRSPSSPRLFGGPVDSPFFPIPDRLVSRAASLLSALAAAMSAAVACQASELLRAQSALLASAARLDRPVAGVQDMRYLRAGVRAVVVRARAMAPVDPTLVALCPGERRRTANLADLSSPRSRAGVGRDRPGGPLAALRCSPACAAPGGGRRVLSHHADTADPRYGGGIEAFFLDVLTRGR